VCATILGRAQELLYLQIIGEVSLCMPAKCFSGSWCRICGRSLNVLGEPR